MSPVPPTARPESHLRRIVAVIGAAMLLQGGVPPLQGQAREPAASEPGGWTVPADMVRIPGGAYTPQYATGDGPVEVAGFGLERTPVTVEEYRAFVRARPEWRRSRVRRVFADASYLASWSGETDPGVEGEDARRPVTEVSWFAARAYCAWRGRRLPTTDEWEYAASASRTEPDAFGDPAFDRELLALYASRPGPEELPPVGATFRDVRGVWDLHGLVWEWTADFNNQMLTGAGRDDRGLDRQLFCAAGSAGATDLSDYAAFLRYAFRSSLEGDYAGRLLGFRCAASPPPPTNGEAR